MNISADHINGAFELFAGGFVLLSIWTILRDQEVKGINWITCLFFPVWSLWNLYFYHQLDLMWSTMSAVMMAYTELVYFTLIIYYVRYPKIKKIDTRCPTCGRGTLNDWIKRLESLLNEVNALRNTVFPTHTEAKQKQ